MAKAASIVKAIHDSDLEKVLKKLGLYEGLVRGGLACAICGRPLTLENLGGLYRENSRVKLVCNRIECLVEAGERMVLIRIRKFDMHPSSHRDIAVRSIRDNVSLGR